MAMVPNADIAVETTNPQSKWKPPLAVTLAISVAFAIVFAFVWCAVCVLSVLVIWCCLFGVFVWLWVFAVLSFALVFGFEVCFVGCLVVVALLCLVWLVWVVGVCCVSCGVAGWGVAIIDAIIKTSAG